MFTFPRLRFVLAAVLAVLVAALVGAPAAAADPTSPSAPSPAASQSPQIPRTINDLTPAQTAMLTAGATSGTKTIVCTDHLDFPGCADMVHTQTRGDAITSQLTEPVINYPTNGGAYTTAARVSDSKTDNGVSWQGIKNAAENTACVVGAAVGGAGGAVAGCAPKVADGAVHAVSGVAGDLANSMFGKISEAVGQSAGDMVVAAMTWWVTTDSIDVSYADVLSGQHDVQLVMVLVMMAGIMSTGMVLMLTRRTQPLAELVTGALRFVLINSLFLIVIAGALHAGDDFAQRILGDSGAQDFGANLSKLLTVATLGNPATVFFLAAVCWLLALISWILGFIRQAGIVVTAAMHPFAAAGQFSTWGRQWFPRMATTCISLVLYKPVAAMLYVIGFKLMGNGHSLSTAVVGVMVIALTVLALPAMMKFFSWFSPALSGGAGAGAVAGAGVAATVGGAGMLAGLGGLGGADSGSAMASYMQSNGPGSGPTDPDPSPGNSLPQLGGGGGAGQLPGGGQGGGPGGLGGGGSQAELPAGPGETPELGPGPDMQTPDTPALAGESTDVADGGGAPMPSADGGGLDAAGSGASAAGGTAAEGMAEGAAAGANPYLAAAAGAAEIPKAIDGATEQLGAQMAPDEGQPPIG